MLPTFRTMVIAVAAVFLAPMVTARGLVTAPEAVTRIGEVPPLGRTLVQLAQVPLDDTQKRFVAEAAEAAARAETEAAARVQQAEAVGETVAAASGPTPDVPGPAADSPAPGGLTLPLLAADERRRPAASKPASADPLGDLIRAVVPETPEPAPRPAAPGADDRAAAVVALATAPLAERSAVAPAEAAVAPGASAVVTAAPAGATAAPPAPSPAMPPEPAAAGPAPADPDPAASASSDPAPADPMRADPLRNEAAAASGEAVVAALPTAEPAAVFGPERPAAEPKAQKAKRAAKPAARKKARASRPAPRRTVARTVSRPAAQAPAATQQTYSPFFGSPTSAPPPTTIWPGSIRR